jgi:hypothetical protein
LRGFGARIGGDGVSEENSPSDGTDSLEGGFIVKYGYRVKLLENRRRVLQEADVFVGLLFRRFD